MAWMFSNGRKRIAAKFVQFCVVGAAGVAVDMAALFVFANPSYLGWNLSMAKAIAAEFAIVNNFIWNDIWTFQDMVSDNVDSMSRLSRFGKFNLICLIGIALNILLLNLQVHVLHWNLYVSNLVGIVIVSVWNFWMNLKVGWGNVAK